MPQTRAFTASQGVGLGVLRRLPPAWKCQFFF